MRNSPQSLHDRLLDRFGERLRWGLRDRLHLRLDRQLFVDLGDRFYTALGLPLRERIYLRLNLAHRLYVRIRLREEAQDA